MSILEGINKPSDIKALSMPELKALAKEIRQVILDTVLTNGGHLASSLGAVEIILAMHYVFDSPEDKFIFDVGHQCYAHKILTGRYSSFSTLRTKGGISGFPKREESEHDAFNTGHSSTSISAACGMTRALKLKGSDNTVISVIGDGALTGGMAYEALNDSGEIGKKQIVILNDNSMSISLNVGSTAKYLVRLHGNNTYRRAKSKAIETINGLDIKNRDKSLRFLYTAKNAVKYFVQGGLPFEQFNLHYLGPINGHDLEELIQVMRIAKDDEESSLIHVVTIKGRGYKEAEENPSKYHGYSPSSANVGVSFSTAFGEAMLEVAGKDDKIFAVTAAMSDGTGLDKYADKFPDRFADVGIAEAHATTMCAGLAAEGYKPYFAVYSSFLQRAYDQLIHDVCLQDLAVTFCIDRSGIVPGDGETHQGIYDISYLRAVPNICIVAPRSAEQLKKVINWSATYNHPLAIKYPKGTVKEDKESIEIKLGKWETLSRKESDIVILAVGGRMVEVGEEVCKILHSKGIEVTFVNALFIKPMDMDIIDSLEGKKVYTLEDNVIAGGFGSAVLECMSKRDINAKVRIFGIDDIALEHASVTQLLQSTGLDSTSIANKIIEDIR